MADPLPLCSDCPVCYGDWKVLRGHIAGESHRLRHSPRALCVVATEWITPDSFAEELTGRVHMQLGFLPASLPWLLRGRCCWRPAGDGKAGTTAI